MKLHAIAAAMGPTLKGPKPDNCFFRQYEEEIAGFKSELTAIFDSVISVKGEDKNLSGRESALDKMFFDVCLKIKRMFEANKPTPFSPSPTLVSKRD